MSAAVHPPIVVPMDARRAMGTEDFARRMGKACQLDGDRVLDLGVGGGALVLAREFGCELVCVDSNEASLEALKTRVAGGPLKDRVQFRRVSSDQLPFSEGEFEAIICVEKVLYALEDSLNRFRPLLAPSGHIALLYPMAVGRRGPRKPWREVFGFELELPRDCFQTLERCGFEPVTADTLSDGQLDAYYDAVEESLRRFPEKDPAVANRLRAELAAHSGDRTTASVTWGCVMGRRKEPGERPPPSRDSG
jgi:ubiquinone/menaquinone biosynthesis C-methylase UbiE